LLSGTIKRVGGTVSAAGIRGAYLRKEGDAMFFEAEERPWTHHLKKPMGGLFAISLGLLVCIADVKLPAETDHGGRASRRPSR
jgi:hypothetical protein